MNSHTRPLTLLLLPVIIACFAAPVFAQTPAGPPTRPILRVETGMHTATISRVGVDRACRFLVTASDDKTARVWELQTGRLLRVLRVPVGDGYEGRIYSTAISPDGNTVAVGGWTKAGTASHNVYLFDRESGRLVRRLTGLSNVILHVAFAPDGTRLAATLGGANGLRVWRTSDWAEAGRDTAYGGDSYGADFDRAGRLVTSSYDGNVRFYDRAMRLLAKQPSPGGKRPYAVRFSPDGNKVAVSYDDSPRLDLLSSETLALLYSADNTGVTDNFYGVAWSADGTMLYAGGRYQIKASFPIRRWEDAGRGRYVDTHAADSTILDIAPLPTGGIVYGASDPAWGVLDANHRRTQPLQSGQIADYRNNQAGFLIDARGGAIRFGYEVFGRSPTTFRLYDRTLTTAAPGGDMRPPLTQAPGLSVTGWESTPTPRVNNTPLKLDQYEISRALAVAPGGERFLLGSDYYVRLFNRGGQELWNVPALDVVWTVNVSGDGRLALAAYADGTIRWYRMTDGKELLAFFPHKDRKRWVIWTPSGYYDASAGAEDLIGWHVNNGADRAADFFPVGQFREVFYRPDVVAKILSAGDEQVALRAADEEAGRKQQLADVTRMLPPVLEIVSPSDNSEVSASEVVVRYTVRTPSGEPVTTVRALVDGRPAAAERGISVQASAQPSGVRELRVALPTRDSEVSLIAENRFATSVPATMRLKWRGAAPPAAEAFVIKPKLYVLAVGVSDYANPALRLRYAAKDARDFAAALARQNGGLYRDVVVKLLTDGGATKDEVLDGLDWIRKETTAKDVAVVLLAGHGVNDANGSYYFLPHNADPERLLRTAVKWSDVRDTVAAVAGKTLFFIDTCHSGNILGTRRALSDDLTGPVNELASAENGAVVFAASTGRQYSLEDEAWGNGAFTKAVVEAIDGRADYGRSGRITVNMLDLYLSERVKELTRGQQTPTTAKPSTVPDFPVALKR